MSHIVLKSPAQLMNARTLDTLIISRDAAQYDMKMEHMASARFMYKVKKLLPRALQSEGSKNTKKKTHP